MSRKKEPSIVASSQKVFRVFATVGAVLAVLTLIVFTAVHFKENVGDRQVAMNNGTQVAPSETYRLVRLEKDIWHDLRQENILLPNKRLDIDFYGCVEVSINNKSSQKVCDGNTKLPDGGGTTTNVEYGSEKIYQMKIRGLTEGAYATVNHS